MDQKDLKKGTYYKYVVKAYRMVNGKKVVTDISISVHAVTGGGKYGNAKAVSVTQIGNKKNVSKITLKMGKTAQIKAKEVKKDKEDCTPQKTLLRKQQYKSSHRYPGMALSEQQAKEPAQYGYMHRMAYTKL